MKEEVGNAPDKRWYALRVVSGKERKIKEHIDKMLVAEKWAEIVTQILVPIEKVYAFKDGKKKVKERNFYPGYILVEAINGKMHADIVQAIRNTNGVINFLGNEAPIPLREAEVNRILGKVDEMQDAGENVKEPFIVGETVKIIDGPFNDFNGNIEEIHEDKKKLKVIVKIFGRRTPVELNFAQVEKTVT
ncbi:MAG TPA: transcription termination/antitermination protein NusG [Chitinophagales bacterium]|nr:transcription termination/antitermination protein NusG [Chitinophagales bacterium]HRK28581.1 transcription termination/antitermination protein NusG [Chitinophagales bacterium]